MLQIALLKMVFKAIGGSRIKFDIEKQRLIIYDDQKKSAKAISFSDMEKMFNERSGLFEKPKGNQSNQFNQTEKKS